MPAAKPKVNPWLIAVAVMLTTFMEVMDTSIAAVAVPYIAGSTASTTDEAEWVLTVYLVSNAAFLLASNYLAERFGRKKLPHGSRSPSSRIASFFCGLSPTLGFILLARIIQGAAGGALQPLSQSILLDSFPPAKQGMALGVFALGHRASLPSIGPRSSAAISPTPSPGAGPSTSTSLSASPRLPCSTTCLKTRPKSKEPTPASLTASVSAFSASGSPACSSCLTRGRNRTGSLTFASSGPASCSLSSLSPISSTSSAQKKPLVTLRALADRNLAWGSVLVFALGAVLYGLTTILPVFFQDLLGYSATRSGLSVSPRGIGSFAAALLVGAAVSRMDARWIVAIGFAVLGYSGLLLGDLTLDISPWTLFWPLTLSGVGLSMIFVPLTKIALGTIAKSETGNASGIFNFLRNIGGSIGISVANTISQRHTQAHRYELLHSFSGSSWLLRRQLGDLTQAMARHAGPRVAGLRALQITSNSLTSQASAYAYVDVLRDFGFLCIACAPLAFFLKKAQSSAGAG